MPYVLRYDSWFQSAPPRGDELAHTEAPRGRSSFNPRPAWGRTVAELGESIARAFQSAPRVGTNGASGACSASQSQFQSAPPAWGRTDRHARRGRGRWGFNPRPRVGTNRPAPISSARRRGFNPPPAWGRTRHGLLLRSHGSCFNPRPAWGRTNRRISAMHSFTGFNPRPRVGTNGHVSHGAVTIRFQSAPRVGTNLQTPWFRASR